MLADTRTTARRRASRDSGVEPRETIVADGGAMWVSKEYRTTLARANLTSLARVMRSTLGRCLRALPHRENWRLELRDDAGMRAVHLKKHHTRSFWSWLRAKLWLGPGVTAGRIEAANIARLERDGIAAMRLVAFGEGLRADGWLESFLMTEELSNFEQLDHFLRRRFPPQAAASRDGAFGALTSAVAEVARRFHSAGYNHRDLYLCHYFIREPRHAAFEVRLIDLQRVERRRWLRGRWLVKDLAQMAYSVPRDRVSRTRQLAFMKRYLGVAKLRACDKRLIRRVAAKRDAMVRHLGAHP